MSQPDPMIGAAREVRAQLHRLLPAAAADTVAGELDPIRGRVGVVGLRLVGRDPGRCRRGAGLRFSILSAAALYADLVEGAFDNRRPVLCRALRFAPPGCPGDELSAGQAVTAYLWEGHFADATRFTA